MKLWKWVIGGGAAAAIFAALWVVSQRPSRVEMATYVPAETLVYLEADDLPQVLAVITETEAWREIAPSFDVDRDYGNFGWLSQTLATANLGSTETIVFGRAQIAVALLGVGTADTGETGESLKIRPQFAVVIETKSSRSERLVEKQIGDFAKKQFGAVSIEKKNVGTAAWTIFRSKTESRDLFAAIQATVVIIGNEESAVQACLDAANGQRKSLADDPNLDKMRAQTEREKAFAFGYVTTEGIKQLSNVGTILAAGQLTEDPRAMSLLAQSLPPFVQKSVTAIGWTASQNAGQIEDRYFVQMPPDLVARLREPLVANGINPKIAELLPADLRSLTFYNLKNPQTAWRGVIFALTTKLDAFSAAALSPMASGLLEPYGVERADDFLGAATGDIVTARIAAETGTVGVVGVKKIDALEKSLRVGGGKKSELVDYNLLLGDAESLQICRAAREQQQTFDKQKIWNRFIETKLIPNGGFTKTLTREETLPIRFVKLFAKEKNKSNAFVLPTEEESPTWFWSVSETGLVREGFERRTVSPFGLIGTLATSLTEK